MNDGSVDREEVAGAKVVSLFDFRPDPATVGMGDGPVTPTALTVLRTGIKVFRGR